MSPRLRKQIFIFVILLAVAPWRTNAQENKPSRNNIKVTMLSLGSGSSRFTFEHAITPRNSFEYTLGVVGWGWDWMNHSDPNGILMKIANKWTLIPQKGANSWIAGLYVKPEFVFADYEYTNQQTDSPEYGLRQHTTQGALLAEAGYQWVLWGWFDFDIYVGAGVSLGTGNANNYYHSFMLFPTDSHLAFTAGYRIGFAF